MRNKRGITLIALVITIVVLLILSGVAIALVVGNNGVLSQASNSVVVNREAKAAEELEMAWASATTKFYTDWALDNSKNLSEYVDSKSLSSYTKETGTVTQSVDNEDGTYIVNYQTKDQNILYKFSVNEEGTAELLEKTEINKLTPLTAKLTLEQIMDLQRDPAYPNENDSVMAGAFTYPYKIDGQQIEALENGHYLKFTNLGTINTLENEDLKADLQNNYPAKDYAIVRLDEYDENDTFVSNFSQGGILYLLNKENGVYLFIASRYSSDNSYGYLICLNPVEAERLKESNYETYTVQDIVENIN